MLFNFQSPLFKQIKVVNVINAMRKLGLKLLVAFSTLYHYNLLIKLKITWNCIFEEKQERMWNSFQGDRESRLFWLLSESIEKDYKKEYVESILRDYREFFERF